MSLRLGKRVLASQERGAEGLAEYERQRSQGLGTQAAQFRLGPRITAHHETPVAEAVSVASPGVPAPQDETAKRKPGRPKKRK